MQVAQFIVCEVRPRDSPALAQARILNLLAVMSGHSHPKASSVVWAQGEDLPEGGTDTHRAFVIAGAAGPVGELRGYAYTDGGAVREHAILVRGGGALEIAEALPDHGQRFVRARKTITPTAEGYTERVDVDVDAGAGFFEYSALMMSRVIGPKQ